MRVKYRSKPNNNQCLYQVLSPPPHTSSCSVLSPQGGALGNSTLCKHQSSQNTTQRLVTSRIRLLKNQQPGQNFTIFKGQGRRCNQPSLFITSEKWWEREQSRTISLCYKQGGSPVSVPVLFQYLSIFYYIYSHLTQFIIFLFIPGSFLLLS